MRELLDISHKQFVTSRLKELDLSLSELTFDNIYLWRKERNYYLVEEEGIRFIEGKARDGRIIILPLEKFSKYRPYLKNHQEVSLFPVPENLVEVFSDEEYLIETSRDWDNYIYQTIKIADLSGRALDGKRNHVKHFEKNYISEVVPYENQYFEKAKQLLDYWEASREDGSDYGACLNALEEFDRLSLTGICLIVDGKIIAFALGQPLSREMYDLQFAKADIAFKGVYPYLYKKFAETILEYKWINYECDLGIEGLRKGKMEFSPDHFQKVYRITSKV